MKGELQRLGGDMSRGAGRIMREALAVVLQQSAPIDSYTIAAFVYAVPPDQDGRVLLSAAQITAVRRALVALVRAGKVTDIGRSSCYPTSRRSYATPEVAARRDREGRALAGAFGGVHTGPSDPIKLLPEGWSASEVRRRRTVESGGTVLANYKQDAALLAWAKAQGLLVRIDIYSPWGNPWHPPRYKRLWGIGQFRERKLPGRLPHIEQLRGKVLACHCYPKACHGQLYIEALAARR
jgi:hypothetical protein